MDREILFSNSLSDMHRQVLHLIDSAMEHKAIGGRNHLTKELDSELGAILSILRKMKEYGPIIPRPLAECDALHDKVIRLSDYGRGIPSDRSA